MVNNTPKNINKEINEIIKRIEEMVRGNIESDPPKPSFVEEQRRIYNFWNAKLYAYLLKDRYKEKPDSKAPYMVRLHFSLRREEEEKKKEKKVWWENRDINIKNAEDWETLKRIIDGDFVDHLGWISKEEALKKLEEKPTIDAVREVFEKRPSMAYEFLEVTDLSKMELNTIQKFTQELLKKGREAMDKYMGIFHSLLSIPKKEQRHIEEMDDIIQKISLYGITATMNHVTNRIDKIRLFERLIIEPSTYERKGKNSIHRILEKNIWILDERYQILRSDKALRSLIQENLPKKYIKEGQLRPDFACSTQENKTLILVEIKRPSHKLTREDLNQVEEYRDIAESSRKFAECECYLLVNSIPPKLQPTVDLRKKINLYVKTYSQVVAEAKGRYGKLMDILEEELKETEIEI